MLIAKFCSSLNEETSKNNYKTLAESAEPSGAAKVMQPPTYELDTDQQIELENIIQDLEEENMFLMQEYTRLQSQLALSSSNEEPRLRSSEHLTASGKAYSTLRAGHQSHGHYDQLNLANQALRATSTSPIQTSQQNLTINQTTTTTFYPSNISLNSNGNHLFQTSQHHQGNGTGGYKVPTLFTPMSSSSINNAVGTCGTLTSKDSKLLAEARLLRQHEDRLEARMKILENHNRLLDSQLRQLKGLLNTNVITC